MSEWKLWDWQHITGSDGSRYISRLHIFRTPWFGAQLHWIHRPDEERHMHNHPRQFVRVVLRGGYTEEIDTGDRKRVMRVNRVSVMRLHYWHRITVVQDGTLSLCLVGPMRQPWGFRTEDGFIPWQRYLSWAPTEQETP